MISPRILFEGDPTEAYKYVGVAKEFGRSTFGAGILSKVWRLGEDVQIRVMNNLQARVCKVWITASGGKAGYQFYTTSPNVQWAYWVDPDTDFCPGGSMIYAPTPQFPRDPLGYQASFTPEELAAIKIYAIPTHTLVEDPPKKQVGLEWVNECPFTPMPATVGGVNGLDQIMNTGSTFAARNAWQINGIPEHACYYTIPKYELIAGAGSDPVFTGHYVSEFSLLTAWQQPGGHVFSYGLYSPAYYLSANDVGYDMAPQKITTKMIGQMPDGDWPERACITRAGTPEYGYRWYVILHTASDDWLCWPYLPKGELDPSIRVSAPAKWRAQAYKSNIPNEYAKKARPEFPDWVYSTGKERRNHSEPLSPEPEPRVTFHFNSTGTKAIAGMVERTPIDEVGEATFKRINFMHPEAGVARSRASWYFDFDNWNAVEQNIHAPVEQDTEIPVHIDASKSLYGESKPPGPQLYQYDRMGIIELEFIIDVTGPDLGDFDFSIIILRDEAPDVLDTYDVGALIDVGYAKPMLSDPLVENVAPPHSNREAQVTDPPNPDELVTAFLTLYQHTDQKKYDLGAYCCSNDTPTKSKVSFYKNDDYHTATNAILELPLSQRHGSGYPGPAVVDPDTGEVIGLPSTPHEFVEYSYNAHIEEHRAPNDLRPERYIYDAKISDLDISTLSFYYTARINKLTTDTEDYVLEAIPSDLSIFIGSETVLHKEFNEQAELCNVYIFGKIAHDSVVGITDMGGHLRGWADKAPINFPEENEEKIPTTYKETTTDLYYSESGTAGNPDFWWLNGACGFCIYKTILSSIYNADYNHTFGTTHLPFPHKNIGAKFHPTDPENPTPGDIITEEEAKDFLRYAVESWGEFIAGNLTKPLFVSAEGGVVTSRDAPYFDTFDACYGNQNPFHLAKADFDLEKFVDQAAWVMMKLCNYITEITSDRIGDPDIGPVYTQNIFKKAVFLLSRKTTLLMYDQNIFDLYGTVDLNKDFNYIKQYDWAVHLYNHYRTRRFTVSSNTGEYGKILTTPEGHYSYYYRDHYALDKKYTALSAYFIKGIRHADVWYPTSPGGGRAVETRVGNDENIGPSNFDWKLVDGVGWYFGLVKTSHLDLYNMAFSETWRTSMRESGRSKPFALASELPIRTSYKEEDFRLNFSMMFSTSPIRGEPLYTPNKAADDFYYTLQLETTLTDNLYTQSPWEFPGFFYFDSREYRKHLRLSPLFF